MCEPEIDNIDIGKKNMKLNGFSTPRYVFTKPQLVMKIKNDYFKRGKKIWK